MSALMSPKAIPIAASEETFQMVVSMAFKWWRGIPGEKKGKAEART
jgi:hypothetical protein